MKLEVLKEEGHRRLKFKSVAGANKGRNVYMYGDATGEKLIKRVRELAKERDIKLPRNIGGGGLIDDHFYFRYTSNAMRDLIREVAKEMKLEEI